MKRLALALILVLALGSVAYAVTPTFSTTVTLTGSETWTDGVKGAFTTSATTSTSVGLSASGTGYSVTAAGTLGNGIAVGKYTAKFTDGKLAMDIWGNAAETSTVATLFSKISSDKAANGSNWRARATYNNVVADVDNAASTLTVYAKNAKGSLGGAVVKDLASLKNAQGNIDVWASGKIGTAAVSGELLLKNKAVTGPDGVEAVAKAVTTIPGNIKATAQLDWKSYKSYVTQYNNTYIYLEKDILAVTAILTNKETKEQKAKLSAKRDAGLNYIYGDITRNLTYANNNSGWKKAATTNVNAVSAEFGIRGSNDQAWGDVFASDKWNNNKTYVLVAKATNIAATKINDTVTPANADDNPSMVLSAEGVYCAIPSKLWVAAKVTGMSDKDVQASMDIDVNAKARHKTSLTPKIALVTDATLDLGNIGTASSTTASTVTSKATYTLATNMSVYASISEAMVAKKAPVNTLVFGYSIKF